MTDWSPDCRIVVSDLRGTYGDARLPAPPPAPQPIITPADQEQS